MVFHTTDREKQRRQELKAILDISDEPSVSFRKKLRGWTAEYYKPALASILILLVTITYVSYYNVFVQMRAKVRGSRGQVMGALQMRQNLVPALTVLMHHFIKHEENIFLNTAKVREGTPDGKQPWEGLTKSLKAIETGGVTPGAMSRLLATAENYPQLYSSQSLQLMIGKLTDAENTVLTKRNEYNMTVTTYNAYLNTFPANFVAASLRFSEEPFFTCDDKPEWVFAQGQKGTEFFLSMSSKNEKTPSGSGN